MKRAHLKWIAGVGLVIAFVAFVASKTYWGEAKVPMPLKGDAATDPTYAAEKFVRELGGRAVRDQAFVAPRSDAVLVLSGWHWGLVRERRERLERWVESGGRLVVDNLLVTSGEDFEGWSRIEPDYTDALKKRDKFGQERCRGFKVEPHLPETHLTVCGASVYGSLKTEAPILWALRDESGIQALRVAVGRGSVTEINAAPFRYREFFEGHHAWLFAQATDLRRGDEVHFLSENDTPRLLSLVWQWGAPVIVLSLLAIVLALWRAANRLGPLKPPARAERRSLAEQIRGTGQFALRHGGGEALHAATVRALEEAARRRLPAYAALPAAERGAALERLSGASAAELLSAVYHPKWRRPNQIRTAIATIEAARRHILLKLTRSAHGTH